MKRKKDGERNNSKALEQNDVARLICIAKQVVF
jgi:hypothetical protein